jgi:hypothetical protein
VKNYLYIRLRVQVFGFVCFSFKKIDFFFVFLKMNFVKLFFKILQFFFLKKKTYFLSKQISKKVVRVTTRAFDNSGTTISQSSQPPVEFFLLWESNHITTTWQSRRRRATAALSLSHCRFMSSVLSFPFFTSCFYFVSFIYLFCFLKLNWVNINVV